MSRSTIALFILGLAALACNLPQAAGDATPTTQSSMTPTDVPPTQSGETPVNPQTGGTVGGKVCYPAGFIPPMMIYLQNTTTGDVQTRENAENVDHYLFADVAAGTYVVFAYVLDPSVSVAGGYTQMVPCGLLATCTDHTLIELIVEQGVTYSDADVCDWYAPDGAFPPRP